MSLMQTKLSTSSLVELLQDIIAIDSQDERNITGICNDSRHVKPGNLFLACIGAQYDGREYINDAIAQGAVAVLAEADTTSATAITIHENSGKIIPLFNIKNLNYFVGQIASRFYENPSLDMVMIGITGTNGKTSCSQFIARCLQAAGLPCGVIGTLGSGFPDHLQTNLLTTPDAVELQAQLAKLKQQNAKAVAMEVSSHSLAQQRVNGIKFDIAIFTNLTRDHLDYHGDMQHYLQAKQLLFKTPSLRYAIINLDDPYAQEFIKIIPANVAIYGYTTQAATANIPVVRAIDMKLQPQGFSANIATPWGNGVLQSKLLGRFNLSNLLAVIAALSLLEIPFEKSLQFITELPTVPGRMQVFGGQKQPTVIVDYAHTPDALQQALTALREHCKGKLWCVFGCGGDRDRGKRALMAQVAERFSDQVIVTEDNPRTENSQQIIADIVQGLLCPWAAEIIADRHDAIAYAVQHAQTEDMILIAGKGHEPYQIIGTEKLPFSDAHEVQLQLSLKK